MNISDKFDKSFDVLFRHYKGNSCLEDRQNAIEEIVNTEPSFDQLISACRWDYDNGPIQKIAKKMFVNIDSEDLSLKRWLAVCSFNNGYPSEFQTDIFKKLDVKNVSFKEWFAEYVCLQPHNKLREYMDDKLLKTATTNDDLHEICNISKPYSKLYRLAFARLSDQLPKSFHDLLTDYYSTTGKQKKEIFEELSKADESVDRWIDAYIGRRLSDSKFEILCLRKILEKSLSPDRWQKLSQSGNS